MVGARRLVENLDGGLHAQVEERGATFSQGERQLLSFARALAFNPNVLVLDEATSSVDTETERLIRDALRVLLDAGPIGYDSDGTPIPHVIGMVAITMIDRVMVANLIDVGAGLLQHHGLLDGGSDFTAVLAMRPDEAPRLEVVTALEGVTMVGSPKPGRT